MKTEQTDRDRAPVEAAEGPTVADIRALVEEAERYAMSGAGSIASNVADRINGLVRLASAPAAAPAETEDTLTGWGLARDPTRPDWPGVILCGPRIRAYVEAGDPINCADSRAAAIRLMPGPTRPAAADPEPAAPSLEELAAKLESLLNHPPTTPMEAARQIDAMYGAARLRAPSSEAEELREIVRTQLAWRRDDGYPDVPVMQEHYDEICERLCAAEARLRAPDGVREPTVEEVDAACEHYRKHLRRDATDWLRAWLRVRDTDFRALAAAPPEALRCECGKTCRCRTDGALLLSAACCIHGEAECDEAPQKPAETGGVPKFTDEMRARALEDIRKRLTEAPQGTEEGALVAWLIRAAGGTVRLSPRRVLRSDGSEP